MGVIKEWSSVPVCAGTREVQGGLRVASGTP